MVKKTIAPESSDPLEQRLPRLGAALREAAAATAAAIEAALPAGATARSASGHLGIGRRLAWHALAFAKAETPLAMARVRPGRRGWNALLAAFERAGAGPERLERLGQAIDRLQEAIDAASAAFDLEAVIAGAAAPRRPAGPSPGPLLRRAHHANRPSAIFTCRAKVLAVLVTRNRIDPERADVTALQLFDTIERRQPGPILPLAACEAGDDRLRASLPAGADLSKVLGRRGPLPPVLVGASSPGVCGAELHACEIASGTAVGFGSRDPRRRGPLRVATGEWLPMAGPIFAEQPPGSDDGAESNQAMVVNGWLEHAVLDLLWHREVRHGGDPIASIHSPSGDSVETWKESPLIESISAFDRCSGLQLPDALRSANAAYRAMLEEGLGFLGETYGAFEHWRYAVECPPMRSMLLVRRPLAMRG
jgi:hypothetical protein